jgi:hypothetical protein
MKKRILCVYRMEIQDRDTQENTFPHGKWRSSENRDGLYGF